MNTLLQARLFSLRVGPYVFSPGIIPTVVLLYTMMYLGMWQLNKGEIRYQLQNTIESRKDLAPVEMHLLPADAQERRYLPVTLRGRFVNDKQFLHDNRVMNGMAGFHVYTPFVTDANTVLLINRGWLPQQRTRDVLPDVSVDESMITITGLVDNVPAKGFVLADQVYGVQWPMILQYLETPELSKLVGTELQPMIVWLAPDTGYGYQHEYPSLNLDSAKNTGYAFQWFAMSTALLIIFLVVNTRKIRT